MTEAELLGAVVELASLDGWLVHHCRPARTGRGWSTPIQGHPGFPDLVLARDGRVIFAELKRQGAKVTPAQARWWRELVTMAVWRPSDWAEIEATLA